MKREKGSTASNHLRQHTNNYTFNIQSFFSIGSLKQDHRHCILDYCERAYRRKVSIILRFAPVVINCIH